MSYPIDLTGKELGKLKVLKRSTLTTKDGQAVAYYECACVDCGDTVRKKSQSLLMGRYNCSNRDCNTREQSNRKYAGKRFGYVTVVNYSHSNDVRTRQYFNCICDCGQACIKANDVLTKKGPACCGCRTSEKFRKSFPGVGKSAHNRMPGNDAAKNGLFKNYERNAKTREIEFCITKEKFLHITSTNCHYCGSPPSKKYPRKLDKGVQDESRYYLYNGLDRVDSTGGYSEDNVVPCCEDCNYAKSDLTKDEFITLVEKIYKHYVKPAT